MQALFLDNSLKPKFPSRTVKCFKCWRSFFDLIIKILRLVIIIASVDFQISLDILISITI